MSFNAKNLVINGIIDNKQQPPLISNNIETETIPDAQYQLNAQELAFLLNILKNTTFVGEQIEITYNTIIKIQNQYLQQK